MFKYILRITFGLCVLVSCSAWADEVENLYQVDVIFFEQTDPKRFDAEVWPKQVGALNTRNSVPLKNKANNPDTLDTLETLDMLDEVGDLPAKKISKATVTLVDPKNMKLSEEASIIKNSKTLRFIQYIAWMQPMAMNVSSTPIYLQAGKNQEIAAVLDIKPVARNLFSVDVDLLYATDQGNRQGVKQFRITKTVKVKRKDIYYLDHPLVGMMILITPLMVD